MKKYSVYEVFLEATNEVIYVGITTSHILVRLSHHICYHKYNTESGLGDYLVKCFDEKVAYNIRVVSINLDKASALKEEKKLINKYRNNLIFFNIAGNINKPSKQCFSIYQIDMKTLQVIKEFPSIRSTKFEGYTPTNIGRVCRRKSVQSDGYFWCYTKDIDSFTPLVKNIFQRNVEELDAEGNVINSFMSMTEAAAFHNVSVTAVSRWIKGLVPSKSNWRCNSEGYHRKIKNTKKYHLVEIYDINGTLVDTTTNIMEYCAEHNIDSSSVYKSLKNNYAVQGLIFKPL